MPRDTELTMANKTAVAVPSAANFAEATVGAASIPVSAPRAGYVPVSNLYFFVRVKNVDATSTHHMTDGIFTTKLQVSVDGGSVWADCLALDIPAAELAVGEIAVRAAALGRDFRSEGVTDPSLIRFRTRCLTTGHTFAQITDTEVTSYLTDKGAYGRSDG